MTAILFRLASVAGLGTVLAGFAGGTTTRPTDPQSALRTFGERAVAYAVMREEVTRSLPKFAVSSDLRHVYRTRARLAAAIKAARPMARQGEIFTPAVADFFHQLIALALSGVDSEAMLRDLDEENEVIPGFTPAVHDTYPEWATHEVPVVLLDRLPVLPEELEYRLIDRALVLWDVDADLIIDVLPDAIPASHEC